MIEENNSENQGSLTKNQYLNRYRLIIAINKYVNAIDPGFNAKNQQLK